MTLSEYAIEYVKGSGWIHPLDAARELIKLSGHGCDWPKASITAWVSTFDKLVTDGQLQRRSDGMIYIAVEEPAPVQLGLF